MSKVRLHNFTTGKFDEVESDSLTEEEGLSYMPLDVETVEESYHEYIGLGLTPFEAVRIVTYEVLLAFREMLVDHKETRRQP